MYERALSNIGLSEKEAKVYEVLLEHGPSLFIDILKNSEYKRGDLYNILDGLVTWGLIETSEKGSKKVFHPKHPSVLQQILEHREKKLQTNKKYLLQALPGLTSMYNMVEDRPGVRMFEGKDGVIAAYEELLDLGKDIDSIEDKGEMAQFIPEYFPDFIKKRVKLGLFNRVVAPSNNPINTSSNKEMRETRYLPLQDFPFGMDVKIAGDSVFLLTLSEEKQTAVAIRIDHAEMVKNYRVLFTYLWNLASVNAKSS